MYIAPYTGMQQPTPMLMLMLMLMLIQKPTKALMLFIP
jgi:hypothetical protein